MVRTGCDEQGKNRVLRVCATCSSETALKCRPKSTHIAIVVGSVDHAVASADGDLKGRRKGDGKRSEKAIGRQGCTEQMVVRREQEVVSH